MMVDATNTVVWEATYKPFGEAEVNPGSTVVNNFRFPGQYYDIETGMHYNWHRYYDPSTGSYLTPDPVGLVPYGPQNGLNHLFNYAKNNPVNLTDPEGLFGMFPWLKEKGPEWHHRRNILQKGKCPAKEPIDKPCEWKSEGELWSHGGFHSYRGVGENIHYQCVYYASGDLMDVAEFEGTYDISTPRDKSGKFTVKGFLGHIVLDFTPWLIWGN